jgi:hypothetical protein
MVSPPHLETAEHLSKLTGQTTVVKEQITTSGTRIATLQGHVSHSYHEVSRLLLTADECLQSPCDFRRNSSKNGGSGRNLDLLYTNLRRAERGSRAPSGRGERARLRPARRSECKTFPQLARTVTGFA